MSDSSGYGRYCDDGGRELGARCGAEELKSFLQHIAGHLADADARHGSVLRDIEERLVSLGEDAHAVRAALPPDLSSAVSRIEDGLELLARRISPANEVSMHQDAAPIGPPEPEEPFHDDPSRGVGGDELWPGLPPSEANAVAASSAGVPALAPEVQPPEGGAEGPADFPFTDAASSGFDHGDGHWDLASAEALTRMYESEPEENHSTRPAIDGESERAARERAARESDGRPAANLCPGRADDGDSTPGWLEHRLVQIASRIEESLTCMRPDSSVAALEARFSSFEERVGSALHDVATRSDVEGLRLVEAHVNELSQHIDRAQSQLARLDAIETHLTRLMEYVSDERFSSLPDAKALSEPVIAKLATAVADRLAERGRGGELGDGHGLATVRLDELRGLVERFVASNRQGDEKTADVLATVQQAMVHLLDRMDAIEQAQAPWPIEAGAGDDGLHGRGSEEDALARVYHHQAAVVAGDARAAVSPRAPASVLPTSAMPAADPPLPSYEANAPQTHLDQVRKPSRPAEGPATPATPTVPDAPMSREPAATEGVRPLAANREDFLAAARRAARQASSQAAAETVQAAAVQPASRRRLAIGERRGVPGLVIATLVVVLAVGLGLTTYNLFKGVEVKPAGEHRSQLVPNGGPLSPGIATPSGGSNGQSPASATSADRAAMNVQDVGNGADTGAGSVLIEDEPAGRTPTREEVPPSTRALAGLPRGVMLDTGSDASAPAIARAQRQQTMAQLSTRLGAAQPGAHSIPAALVPQASEPKTADAGAARLSVQSQGLPPAAVGPLSLRLAAANGDPSAEFEVGARLAEGKGVQQDLKQAVAWYQRSAAQGFAPAQYRLGTLYERGLGVKADLGRARAWYKSAADKGNVKAMHNLAVLSAGSNPADYATAAHWFTEAAQRGVRDSQYNLAILLENGMGVERDLKAAYVWFGRAATAGDKEAARRRDQIRPRLADAEIVAAEAQVRAWRPQPVDAGINDPRAAGEAWKSGAQGA